MAGAQIEFLLTPFVDVNGDPLVGGIVKFFEAGTTTPVTVYSDSGLTTPIGTQGILDSRGILEAFTDGAVLLKIELYEGAVLLKTYDGLAYSGELSSTNQFYRRDGSLPLTGNMNVAGYDLNNCGNINVSSGKHIFVNHGSSYTPVGTDQIIFGDGDATFRQWSQGGKGKLYKGANHILDYDENSFGVKVPVDMNVKKITNMAAGTTSGDAVEYSQWSSKNTSQDSNITALQTAVGDTQAELNDTQTGAGLDTDGSYPARVGTNYLDTSTSLYNDGTLLDTQAKTNADAIFINSTNITTLSSDLSTHVAATGTSVHGLGTVSTLASTTTLGDPGTDSNVPTEAAVRSAITAASGGAISAQDNDAQSVGLVTTKSTIIDLTLTGKVVSSGRVHVKFAGAIVSSSADAYSLDCSAIKDDGTTNFTLKGVLLLTNTAGAGLYYTLSGTNSASQTIAYGAGTNNITFYAERLDDNTIRLSFASTLVMNCSLEASCWA